MPVPPKEDPEKFCTICGARLVRKRFNGRLEDRTRFLSRKTCGQSCGNSRETVSKSANHWRAHQMRANSCADCGTTASLHVHHVDRNPANNEPSNLMTLCGSCHLKRHWREDREKRLAAARRGARMRRSSTGGSASSDA